MTTDLLKFSAYKRYLEIGKEQLSLGEFDKDDEGRYLIHVGEAYCRVPGCSSLTKYTTNNLRKHVNSHEGTKVAPGRSGHAKRAEIDSALRFYCDSISVYDANALQCTTSTKLARKTTIGQDQEEEGEPVKPELPMRKDRKAHNIIATKKIVKDLGYSIPCDACKSIKNKCCVDLENCPYRNLFGINSAQIVDKSATVYDDGGEE